jgi:TP901 family phage tail tape measure protein
MSQTERKIVTKLTVDGDAEYSKKLKNATASLSEQKSALKLLNEEYKNSQNSLEALQKKVEQLKLVQAENTKVVEAAKEGLLNATKEQSKYAAQVEAAKEKIKNAEDELSGLNTSTEEGAKRQQELTEEIKKYQSELDNAEAMQQKATEAVDDWAAQQSKAKTNLNNTNMALLQTEGYLKEATESSDGFATSIDAQGKKVKQAANNQENLNKKYENTSAAIDALTGSIAAGKIQESAEKIKEALLECIDAAADFETALAKVSTIADTESVSLSTIQSAIMELSNKTGKSVTDLSDAAYNAISAGVDTANAVEFVATANKLATGGFTDSTTAVDILTTALNAYGLEVSEVSQVSDYLITTQNLGKTTVNELAASLGKVIPVASAYNVEMDNLSAAMAILTANGIATAEGTTYLKAAINELGDSSSTVAVTLQEKTGKSFSQLMAEGYSLGDAMEILADAVGNDNTKFNELWSSSTAGIAALSILSSGSAKYNSVLSQMQVSAGATEKAYAKMADTTEVAEQKLTNAFDNLKIAVGSELQNQMNGAYESGTNLVNWATEFVETNEWVVPAIEMVAGVLSALAVGITGVTVVTKILIPLWAEFTGALATNPVGAIVLGVTALAAAITPLILNTKELTSETLEQATAWKELGDELQGATDAYKEQQEAIAEDEADITKLTTALINLTSGEGKSVTFKQAILSLVDQLNEKIPELNLAYDEQTGKLNMTNEELEKYIQNQVLLEKYENAVSQYATIYADNMEATEALEEAQEKLAEAQEKLKEKQEELVGTNSAWNSSSQELTDEINTGAAEVRELQDAVDSLSESVATSQSALTDAQYDMDMYTIETATMTEAQRAAIDTWLEEASTMEEGTPEYYERIDAIAALAEKYNESYTQAQADMDAQIAKIEELQAAYDESYQSAYTSITNQLGLFDEMQAGTSISIDQMIANLDSQISYMDDYAENMRTAMELGVNEGILQQLSDGSAESAAILQEIVDGGEEKIGELNEKFAQVEDGKDEFASAIAEMETQYNTDLETLVQDTAEAVQNMARYDDAYDSAVQTCNGIITGIDESEQSVVDRYTALANAAVAAYNAAMVIKSPSRRFKQSSEMTMEGIMVGVDSRESEVLGTYQDLAKKTIEAYNSEMEEIAERGNLVSYAERIPQVIEEKYISGNSTHNTTNNSTTQNFYISTPVKSPSELMRAARLEQKYGLAGA